MGFMRWLVDGYNVIRRSPILAESERESLEAGRQALLAMIASAAGADDRFVVVFDGAGGVRAVSSSRGVQVVFSSARERADDVLADMARQGGVVVSSDHGVKRAAARAGALTIGADEFLRQLESARPERAPQDDQMWAKSEDRESTPTTAGPRKGNPRRLGKKARARARALGRLRPPAGSPGPSVY